jgi:hypothetical protein
MGSNRCKRLMILSITHKFRSFLRCANVKILESLESFVIPCRAPDSRSWVLDGSEKQQIGVERSSAQ